jgi:hypothetical protein
MEQARLSACIFRIAQTVAAFQRLHHEPHVQWLLQHSRSRNKPESNDNSSARAATACCQASHGDNQQSHGPAQGEFCDDQDHVRVRGCQVVRDGGVCVGHAASLHASCECSEAGRSACPELRGDGEGDVGAIDAEAFTLVSGMCFCMCVCVYVRVYL